MNEEKYNKSKDLDCVVTVNDGSYMNCDMIEEESAENAEKKEDYHI